MAKLNYYPKAGHCFPDLVERKDGKIKAQMRAIIWSVTFQKVNKSFMQIAKTPLEDGMNILFRAKVTYHQTYGFSLQILHIDPEFTLGELAVEKEKCLQQLREDGIYTANKKLPTPLLIKRLAIISYNTSKGYLDFLSIINQYKHLYTMSYQLFPSLLQGDKAEKQLVEQLQLIEKRKKAFDAICIIRGGGGEVGMNCYNSYLVASAVAKASLPVYTGIGHATNQTVCEMIAHKNCITPTDFAYEVIEKFKAYALRVDMAQRMLTETPPKVVAHHKNTLLKLTNSIHKKTNSLVRFHHQKLQLLNHQLHREAPKVLVAKRFKLLQIIQGIQHKPAFITQSAHKKLLYQQELLRILSRQIIAKNSGLLSQFSQQIKYLSPESVLRRGYSLLLKNGKILTDASQLQPGDIIENRLWNASIQSEIKIIAKDEKDEVR